MLSGVTGADPLAELSRLQDKDLELDRIRDEENRTPEALIAGRKRWKALEAELGELQVRLQGVRLEFGRNDLEIKDLSQKRARAQDSERRASSDREQMQFNNVVLQLGDRIKELEDSTMPLLEQIEGLEGEVERVKGLMDEAKPKLDEEEEENRLRIEMLEADYQTKWAARSELAATIPVNIVKEYEAIRKARKGTGLAKMLKAGAGYRCHSCNVQLPMHIAQKVHAGSGVVRCPSCGRILWKGE
jgi:hypothetical protein